jgi:two-component system, LytTR family, response regulator
MYKVLIVDDEEKARKNLRNVLVNHKDFTVSAEAENGKEALDRILSEQPDLVFLDVKMPQEDGFALLDNLLKLGIQNMAIVFLTAYDEFALKAIKYAVFDYILKPVDPEELEKTLNKFRAKKIFDNASGIVRLKEMLDSTNKIRFSTRTGYIFLLPRQIVYIKADGSYSKVHDTENKMYMVSRNLKEIEELIGTDTFIRVHKSYLINKQYLEAYIKDKRICLLKFGTEKIEIPVSFRYTRNISF